MRRKIRGDLSMGIAEAAVGAHVTNPDYRAAIRLPDAHAGSLPGCLLAETANRDRRVKQHFDATEGLRNSERCARILQIVLVDEAEDFEVRFAHGLGHRARFPA